MANEVVTVCAHDPMAAFTHYPAVRELRSGNDVIFRSGYQRKRGPAGWSSWVASSRQASSPRVAMAKDLHSVGSRTKSCGSVCVSFTPVRHRSPVVALIVFAQATDADERR
jgi:hypothetical protein